jgi:hypothetical protein
MSISYPESTQYKYDRKCTPLRCFFQAGRQEWMGMELDKVKGTVSRDFLLLVLFMNQFPPSPRVFHKDRFEFYQKFAEIFAAQGLPPVSTTPVATGKNLQSEKF